MSKYELSFSNSNLLKLDKEIVTSVLDSLMKISNRAEIATEQLNRFIHSLAAVNQEKDFFALVDEIIIKEKEIYHLIKHTVSQTNEKTLAIVNNYLMSREDCINIYNLLNFNTILSMHIRDTKERLSLDKALASLSPEKRVEALSFIDAVKRLKPIADALNEQKANWKAELTRSKSIEEVEKIDKRISEEDKIVSEMYSRLLPIPTDEETAGAVIQYLEQNPHIVNLMQSFDYYESMLDDILYAESKQNVGFRV